jgi:SNF2 family DNA or RNA helicase
MEDLYSQFQFLDPGVLGCRTFYTFRARYCKMGGFKNKKIVGYYNIEELQGRIASCSKRVLKADCLDLPPKVYVTLPFRLSPQQRRLYDAVKKESLEDLEQMIGTGGAAQVISEMAMTRILRLQQITSGLMPETDGLPIPGDNARMDALRGYLEDVQGKVIIFARFRADIENICKHLPAGSFVQLHGGVKQNDRIGIVKSFQEDPGIRYFVGNPAAAGIGITLTAAETVIYYSQDFNLEYRLQSEDRAHRIGQEKTVTILDMVAEKTVDEKIVKALRSKHSLAKLVLKDPAGFLS